ncbi:MAG: phosphotransferase [Candidatus Omnitrophota bacterium]|nr:phosphotransferase [Candidatus Omnitrophota bacterium]
MKIPRFLKIIVITLMMVSFTSHEVMLANPDIGINSSTLQVQSRFNPAADQSLLDRTLIELPLKYILEKIPDIRGFRRSFWFSPEINYAAHFNFSGEESYEGNGRVITCVLKHTPSGQTQMYEAVIASDKSFSLRAAHPAAEKPNIDHRPLPGSDRTPAARPQVFIAWIKRIAEAKRLRYDSDTRFILHVGENLTDSQTYHIYNYMFNALGVNMLCVPFETPLEDLASIVEAFGNEPSVVAMTIGEPHKLAIGKIVKDAEVAEDSDADIGMSLLVKKEKGGLVLVQRKGEEWVKWFEENVGKPETALTGKTVTILGVGATGRRIAEALVEKGIKRIVLSDIDAGKAAGFAAKLKKEARSPIEIITIDAESEDRPMSEGLYREISGSDIIINVTGLGKQGKRIEVSPLIGSAAAIPSDSIAIDLNYRPAKTKFLRQAEARGAATHNGLGYFQYTNSFQARDILRYTGGGERAFDEIIEKTVQFPVINAFNAFESGFEAAPENCKVEVIRGGYINDTYRLTNSATGRKYIVQKVKPIFDIGAIDINLQIFEEAQKRAAQQGIVPSGWCAMTYLNIKGVSKKIYYDNEGNAWRVMNAVPDEAHIVRSFNEIPAEDQMDVAQSLGKALLTFRRMLETVPLDSWAEPLPNFHNHQYHLNYLDSIIRGEEVVLSLSRNPDRKVRKKSEIMTRYADRIAALLEKIQARRGLAASVPETDMAVAHGDTQINNVVFMRNKETNKLVCTGFIDLDTIQKGYRLEDISDALRSAGNTAGDNPVSIDDVVMDSGVISNIIRGSLSEISRLYGPKKADEDRSRLLDETRAFIYELCIRFFADTLVGNQYFSLKPGEADDVNLYRAEVQMRALEKLEEMLPELKKAVGIKETSVREDRPDNTPLQSTAAGTAWTAASAGAIALLSVPLAISGIIPWSVTIGLAATSAILFVNAAAGRKSLDELTPQQARVPNIFIDSREIAHYTNFRDWLKELRSSFLNLQFNGFVTYIFHEIFHSFSNSKFRILRAISRNEIFAYTMQAVSIASVSTISFCYFGTPSLVTLTTVGFAAAMATGMGRDDGQVNSASHEIKQKIIALRAALTAQDYLSSIQPIRELGDASLLLKKDPIVEHEVIPILFEVVKIYNQMKPIDHVRQAACAAINSLGKAAVSIVTLSTDIPSGSLSAVIELLVKLACSSRDSRLQQEALSAVDVIGRPAVLSLIHGIEDSVIREAVSSPELLRKLGQLCVLFKDSAQIKEEGVKVLCRVSNISGSDELAGREHIRETAISALGELGVVLGENDPLLSSKIIPQLRNKAFYARDTQDNALAASFLVKIGAPAIPLLLETAEDAKFHREAIETLVRIGQPAIKPLMELLKKKGWGFQKVVREDIYELNTRGIPNAYLFVKALEGLILTQPLGDLLELYNRSQYKKPPYMTVRVEDDMDRAGDAFAAEIIRGLQYWRNEPEIAIHLCTGGSPFIGYRKLGGDTFLKDEGRYKPEELEEMRKKYGRMDSILESWDTNETQNFLVANGLDPTIKPDMSKVIAFAVDGVFPQKETDYFAFANLLDNVCDLWGIPGGKRDRERLTEEEWRTLRNKHRRFFRGDVNVRKVDGRWVTTEIVSQKYGEILADIDKNGLKIREYQAACLLRGDRDGFSIDTETNPMRLEKGKVVSYVLKREAPGRDFKVEEHEIKPLDPNNPKDMLQYWYLEGMRNQAIMMREEAEKQGGAHITLLGVGYSYEGKGHIGFCESGTPFEQTCFINGIYDHDATFHISGAHAKEFYGFKNMFVDTESVRMPRFGFITFGPADLLRRQDHHRRFIYSTDRDISKEVYVIIIATDNYKSPSVSKAVERDMDPAYPLSLTQGSRGVYVLERAAARELRVLQRLWEFQVFPPEAWTLTLVRWYLILFAKSIGCKIRDTNFRAGIRLKKWLEMSPEEKRKLEREDPARVQTHKNRIRNVLNLMKALRKMGHNPDLFAQYVDDEIQASSIRPEGIMGYLNRWKVLEGDTFAFMNPHMDDDILAMMHIMKSLPKSCQFHVFYNSYGYTAVYSDYVLWLLEAAEKLNDEEIKKLGPADKERLFNELIAERANYDRYVVAPKFDYEPHMSDRERGLRARILLIDLNDRKDLKGDERKRLQNKFRTAKAISRLRGFLAEVNTRKPRDGGRDLVIMNYAKTSVRFMEAAPAIMHLGIPYRNIHWPLDITYGALGRAEAISRGDIDKMKQRIADVQPRAVFFCGEGFPDFGGHSNTEMGTYISLFELLEENKISPETILFQWAGVWDRIPAELSQLGVVLTKEELEELQDEFKFFYRSQALFTAPVTNASSAKPQSFAEDVAVTARESAKELLSLVNLAPPLASILSDGGGVLNYRVRRLDDPRVISEVQMKKQELERVGPSTRLSSSKALIGDQPYPQRLYELNKPLVTSMCEAGAISNDEKKLFEKPTHTPLLKKDAVDVLSDSDKNLQPGTDRAASNAVENRTRRGAAALQYEPLSATAVETASPERFLGDITNDKILSQNLGDGLVSLFKHRKVALLFDSGMGGIYGSNARAVFRVIEELKKEPQYKEFLENMEVYEAPPERMADKANGYLADGALVFTFARADANVRNCLRGVEGKVRATYVDETSRFQAGLPLNIRYPLPQIVAITLAQAIDNQPVDKLSALLEKLSLELKDEGGVSIFTILPGIKQYDNEQEIVQWFANLKTLLRHA